MPQPQHGPAPPSGSPRHSPTAAEAHSNLSTSRDATEQRIAPRTDPPLAAGSTLGRFRIIELVGQGGMGQVYAAYDPKLDRTIALKRLRRVHDGAAQAYFRREAQAMAQLNHPNVLPIYDVGVVDDNPREAPELFIAMEYVEGQSLRQWLKAEAPADVDTFRFKTFTPILNVFIAAGRGLAAAHRAGLIHRDFKPSNVMIGRDGRVRVMDFGLARLAPSMTGELPDTQQPVFSLEASRTGVVVGTPSYMAPEQHLGGELDGRCDQYSFCVALWEAFYSRRPFRGQNMNALYIAKSNANFTVPAGRRLPRWLHHVLVRGLSPAAADRFESMDALLNRLERQPIRLRRRRQAAGIATLVVGSSLVAVESIGEPSDEVCQGARDKLVDVWDPPTRARVEATIMGTDLAFAPDTWRRLAPVLDDYADRWVLSHTEACTATHVEHTQPEPLMDLRMRCLDARLSRLQALVGALVMADAKILLQAVQSASTLPALSRCSDQSYVQSQIPVPEDPAVEEQVKLQRARLVEANMLQTAAKYEEGLAIALQVHRAASELGYGPLLAEAALRVGWLQDKTGDFSASVESFKQAYFEAGPWGLDETRAYAALLLIISTGLRQARHDEALDWYKHATAAVERLADERLRAASAHSIGIVYLLQGKYDLALESFERALSGREQIYGPVHFLTADSLNNIGAVCESQGKYDLALEAHQRVLSIREQTLGPLHPDTAGTLNNIGNIYNVQGKDELALVSHRRALEIRERALGPNHIHTADSLNNIARIYKEQGRVQRALKLHERALSIYEQGYGPQHPRTALSLGGIGQVYRLQGKLDGALEVHRRALSIREQALGPLNPQVALSLLSIGELLLTKGEPEAAIDGLERALFIREQVGVAPEKRAEARFALARALVDADGDLSRAHKLAQTAQVEYAEAGEAFRDEARALDQWLSTQTQAVTP